MIKSAASLNCSNMFYFTVIDNLDRKLFKASHFNFPGQGFLKARFRLFASLRSSPAIVTRFNRVTRVLSTGRRENLGTRLRSIWLASRASFAPSALTHSTCDKFDISFGTQASLPLPALPDRAPGKGCALGNNRWAVIATFQNVYDWMCHPVMEWAFSFEKDKMTDGSTKGITCRILVLEPVI